MDKYEYQVCADQIKSLIAQKRFPEAMEIADTIDWRRVKSVSMLCTVSEIYKINKRYEDSRDILLLAYERYPNGRSIVYALCELAIKMNDIVQAIECYKEYVDIAPDDPSCYILLYKIYVAQEVSLDERIEVLEELKRQEYKERWAYELAYLYHLAGNESKCVAECDELILWFGEGKYVTKAMELKLQHTELSPDQGAKYYNIRKDEKSVDDVQSPAEQAGQGNLKTPHTGYTQDIVVKPVNSGKWNTMDLQEALGNQVKEVLSKEDPVISDFYTSNEQVYAAVQQAEPQPVIRQPIISQQIINNPSEYDNVLSQEYDGQISMSIPEQHEPEKQITGQINLDDIFKDWDDKHGTVDDEKKKKLEETSDIMSQLAGVIPGIQVPEVRIKTEPVINTPKTTSEITDAIPGTLPSGRVLTLEEEYGGKLADIRREDEEAIRQKIDDPGQSEPVTIEEEAAEPLSEESAITGHLAEEEPAAEVLPADESSAEPEEEAIIEPLPDEIVNEVRPVELVQEPGEVVKEPEELVKEPEELVVKEAEEVIQDPEEVMQEPEAFAVPLPNETNENYPYEPQEDYGEVEELEELEQTDEIDDMIRTRDLPVDDIARVQYEAGIEAETDEYDIPLRDDAPLAPEGPGEENEEEEKPNSRPKYMVMRETIKSRRDFDEDEEKIFMRFEGIEPLKAQIVDVMDDVSMSPFTGNVVVMGSDITGRKSLAIDIVKAIQAIDSNFSGKVAKISGEALNKKNIPVTLSKLHNRALIVENAGGLTEETIVSLTESLSAETEPILVVLEGQSDSLKPLLNVTKEVKTVFSARIEIEDYTNDDLVQYGCGYAREREYSIDEMGVLALYTKIGEMQTLEHKVSVEEVERIVDAAIKHVDKKNMAHFMDVLFAKRYDDDDFIILREKDFII